MGNHFPPSTQAARRMFSARFDRLQGNAVETAWTRLEAIVKRIKRERRFTSGLIDDGKGLHLSSKFEDRRRITSVVYTTV